MGVNYGKILRGGLIDENPTLVQVIGMCPTLAVTTSAANGIGMGLTTTAVLTLSNLFISLLRNIIPDKVRIPCYVVVIAGFVTLLQIVLNAWLPSLNDSLGLFIPLIVVNCIILARAEAYAAKSRPLPSVVDGFSMGIGFTAALAVMGIIREFLGNGSFFGLSLPEAFPRTLLFVLPPGAFITLGLIIAVVQWAKARPAKPRDTANGEGGAAL